MNEGEKNFREHQYRGGRKAGSPDKDRVALRALIAERVHEYTLERFKQDAAEDIPEDKAQRIIEDYDAVVEMALIAVDARSPRPLAVRCHAEVAKYTRPQLKAVEFTDESEQFERKSELAGQLMDIVGEITKRSIAKGVAEDDS